MLHGTEWKNKATDEEMCERRAVLHRTEWKNKNRLRATDRLEGTVLVVTTTSTVFLYDIILVKSTHSTIRWGAT